MLARSNDATLSFAKTPQTTAERSGGATDLDDVVGEGVLAEHLQRAAVVQQAPDLQTPTTAIE